MRFGTKLPPSLEGFGGVFQPSEVRLGAEHFRIADERLEQRFVLSAKRM